MKSWKLFFFMSLMIVAMGCGKSGGGGGGGSGSSYSPYTGSNLTGTNLTYMNELQAYMSAGEPSNITRFQKVAGAISSYGSGSTCQGTIKKFLGIEFCVYTSSGSTSNTNMLVTQYLASLPQNGDVNYPISCVTDSTFRACTTTEVISYSGKGSNTALTNALSGHNNSLTLLAVNKSGTIYQIAYGSGVLSSQPSLVYTIDTSKHSMYNPVQTINYQTLTQEYLQF